jgi:hypothetical protein
MAVNFETEISRSEAPIVDSEGGPNFPRTFERCQTCVHYVCISRWGNMIVPIRGLGIICEHSEYEKDRWDLKPAFEGRSIL